MQGNISKTGLLVPQTITTYAIKGLVSLFINVITHTLDLHVYTELNDPSFSFTKGCLPLFVSSIVEILEKKNFFISSNC